MELLKQFIDEYKALYAKITPRFDNTLLGQLKRMQYTLLDDKFSPSSELKRTLDRLQMRCEEPMHVAITGQFSSGKSTFLNALLAKPILPTGITPVTSKINYVRYGESFSLHVRYKDGRDAYHAIEAMARFTDQRESIEDVEYLTLYAPLEILKEIVFVDTPGLNSQAKSDTQTTQRVLQEVDGIIWLSLIDNAGKMSELETIRAYLGHYHAKSLCVLNQKDKLTPAQVEQSVAYVKEAFGEYFSDIVPISAKEALLARSHDKKAQMEAHLETMLGYLHVSLKQNMEQLPMAEVVSVLEAYQRRIDGVRNSDITANEALLERSNITKVLAFIHEEIRPQAIHAKTYAITKERELILERMRSQHLFILGVYDELIAHLEAFEAEAKVALHEAKERFSTELAHAFTRIEEIILTISNAIFEEIGVSTRTRYEADKKGMLRQKITYRPITYEAPKIHADTIYKKLFYEENLIGARFKSYVKTLQSIQEAVNAHNHALYATFEKRVLKWQMPYEIIRKQESIHSDVEFANLRKFASKAYETILKPYHDSITDSYAKISSEFHYLSSAIRFNYQNATQVCVAFLENKIELSAQLYEQNPTRFTLYRPKQEEIVERLRESFHLYALEQMMQGGGTFLRKDYDQLMSHFETLTAEKRTLLERRKERHSRAIEQINRLF